MSLLRNIKLGLRTVFRKKRAAQELDEELTAFLEMAAEQKIEQGLSRKEAIRAVRLERGTLGVTKEVVQSTAWESVAGTYWMDVRFGVRMLLKSPGFAAVTVLTLALGIGVNTAVFSAVDTVLLQPLPYSHPEQLMLVSEALPQLGADDMGVAAGEYLDYRDRNRSFSQTAAYQDAGFNLTGAGTPLRVTADSATASLFPLLGVRPILGRTFAEEESVAGADGVAVISHDFWQRQYGGDSGVLGKTIKLDEKPYSIIGVMPASFRFPSDAAPASERVQLWVPLSFPADLIQDRLREFGTNFIGRLKPGFSGVQAAQDIENVAQGFMREHAEVYSGSLLVKPRVFAYAAHSVSKTRPLLLFLMAAVACVLLIACANVGNLLLARASRRSREMSIRAAVGAVRRRLIVQCLIESLLLALLGGMSGILLAGILVAGLRRFGPPNLGRLQDIAVHPHTLVFTLLVCVITSIAFGLIPALRLSQTSPQSCMKESAQPGLSRATQTLQTRLVICEIAIALVLVIGGSVLLKSFIRVLNVPFGFDPNGVIVVRTLFDRPRYPDPAKRAVVQRDLLERLSHLPGIRAVGAASHLPLSDERRIGFRLENAAEDDYHWAENSMLSPGYFQTMGMSFVRGKDFSYADTAGTPPVAVVNEMFAKKFLMGADPIQQRFHWGGRGLFSVIGIVNDVRISALDAEPPPMIYFSMFQIDTGASAGTAFVLRLDRSSEKMEQGIFKEVQETIWTVDKDLPAYNTTTLTALVSDSVAQRRFMTLLMSSFALLALLMAAMGLFSVISYTASERTRELAVRMALGARRGSIYWMILRRGGAMALFGCLAGLAAFSAGSRLLEANLYQVSAFDPATLILAPLLLIGVAFLACYLPARRATQVDPLVSLRYE